MSEFAFENDTPKTEVVSRVREYLRGIGLSITATDDERPWGGFYVIDESQTSEFVDKYFPGTSKEDIERGFRLSPKILLVEPNKRLSWQYHDRRAELWRVVAGPVGVVESFNDEQGEVKSLAEGDTMQHGVGVRHRLVGLDGWGVVAEIWQHTDTNNPSDENDIVRLQDDFGRQSV